MKRIKPEDITLSSDFTTVPPPKRFVPSPSPHFFQHPTNRIQQQSYHSYLNQGQNFLYGGPSSSVQIPSQISPSQWQYQKQHPPPVTPPLQIPQPHASSPRSHQPLVFDPSQPPPLFTEHRNSPVPQTIPKNMPILSSQSPTTNPLMLHHPIRLRGRGRGQFRGTGIVCSFDRGGRLRNPTANIINPLSVKSPQLLFTNGQQCQMIEVDCTEENQTHVNKKNKRKPMSTRYTRAKEWDLDDAVKALDLEKEYNRLQRTPMLILKFPDPDLNKYIVKKYSQFIETVHFQQPSTPRYCFVQLKEGSDIEKVRKELCEIPFGTGKITAERKFQNTEEGTTVTPEEIDPYTLYIGNLPTQISVKTVKEHFPKAIRIDIGYAQRMKYTRYAFIRYSNVDDSMEAYKKTFNTLIANRSLIVRFRRAKGNIGLPGESKAPNSKKTITTTTTATPTTISATVTTTTVTSITTTTPSEIITKLPKNFPSNNDISEIIIPDIVTNETTLILNNNLPIETEDTKVNVLRDAHLLSTEIATISDNLSKTSSVADNNNPTVKNELEDSLYPNLPTTNGTVPVNNILGTRIKDEPFDDDELLAQARCYEDDDMDDDEFDCEPEEEDDSDDNTIQNPTESSIITSTTEVLHKQSQQNWEEIRQTELTRDEIKPDIVRLLPFPDGDDNTINKPNTKLPDPFAKKTDKENLSFSNNMHDDLDELFNSMNPDDENDEYNF